ncbi:MAG: phosphomannomutase/phosphoglucomutase [Firmicutes bacterium]|nr:phosphomannomutase/phosphoglucomutase [Bacillota bacterium]
MKFVKEINKNIFREYDVRGVYPTDINEDFSYTFGKAYGTYIKRLGQERCVVGYDNRLSSKSLQDALIEGIISSGMHVISIGLVTTPLFYFACLKMNIPAGVMITASHNPKDDNGFKFSFDDRGNARGEMIQDFYQFIMDGDFDNGSGVIAFTNLRDEYFNTLLESVKINPNRRLKVVIDCGNGTTSFFAPDLFNVLNIDLTVLYGKSDATFPNHHPDPSVEENLKVLKSAVTQFGADVGIAFDGDGDRVRIINEKGESIASDEFMMLMARDILPNSENKRILYDVKCSKALPEEIERLGGTPIINRTGNSYTKAATKEQDCVLGGEFSGHIFFRDRFMGIDSALYAALRVLELLSNTDKSLSQLLEGVPKYYSTPEIIIPSSDELKHKVVKKIKDYCEKEGYKIITLDGVRVELEDGWALIRVSNTGPNITARFEGKTEEIKEQLKTIFLELINKYNK